MSTFIQRAEEQEAHSHHWYIAILKFICCQFLNQRAQSHFLGMILCNSCLHTPNSCLHLLSCPVCIKSQSTQTTITNYHSLGSLNHRYLFLPILKTRSLRSACQHGQAVVRKLFLSCTVCQHSLSSVCTYGENNIFLSLFLQDTILIMGVLLLMTLSNFIISQRSHLQIPSLGISQDLNI